MQQKIKLYSKFLDVRDIDDLVNAFSSTIIDTNRDHGFFVDWSKVKQNVEKYKIQCNIFNSLIGSKKFDDDLIDLLNNYPEILPVIPLLVAVRDMKCKVTDDFMNGNLEILEYDFTPRVLNSNEIAQMLNFVRKTGIKEFFEQIAARDIFDYITGVEVGLDTHARKNRSGNSMEHVLKSIIANLNANLNEPYKIIFQKPFSVLETRFGITVADSIANRKADFILVKKYDNRVTNKVINIEINFYSGTGSKPQEIVDSYINRQRELYEHGFDFIWITDGYGWKGQRNQIKKGFNSIDYLLNLHFVKLGLLEHILSL